MSWVLVRRRGLLKASRFQGSEVFSNKDLTGQIYHAGSIYLSESNLVSVLPWRTDSHGSLHKTMYFWLWTVVSTLFK